MGGSGWLPEPPTLAQALLLTSAAVGYLDNSGSSGVCIVQAGRLRITERNPASERVLWQVSALHVSPKRGADQRATVQRSGDRYGIAPAGRERANHARQHHRHCLSHW